VEREKLIGENKSERILFASVCVVGLVFYISQGFLYTWQAQKLKEYFSDLYVYIDWIKNGTKMYSFAEDTMSFAYRVGGETGVGVLLALFCFGSWIASYLLLKRVTDGECPKWLLLLAALFSQLAFTAYIPGRAFYRGLNLTVNNFHSPTYNQMELFSIGAMICAFSLLKDLRGKLKGKVLAAFAVLCAIATYTKPSFLFCMAPALLVFLIIDFICTRAENIKNEVLVGVCVLPGVAVALYQSTLLFDENSKIIFAPVLNWLTNSWGFLEGFPRAGVFALAVLLLYGYKYIKKHWFAFSYAVCAVGTAEYLALMETGDRAEHGNLSWSAHIGLFFALLAGIAVLVNERKNKKDVRFVLCALLLLWQVVSGVIYYLRVIGGGSFWI